MPGREGRGRKGEKKRGEGWEVRRGICLCQSVKGRGCFEQPNYM